MEGGRSLQKSLKQALTEAVELKKRTADQTKITKVTKSIHLNAYTGSITTTN